MTRTDVAHHNQNISLSIDELQSRTYNTRIEKIPRIVVPMADARVQLYAIKTNTPRQTMLIEIKMCVGLI